MHQEATQLVYPQRAVIAVWGLSGAGKSTFLKRIFHLTGREKHPVITDDGVVVIDSEQARRAWSKLPRRLTHLLHVARIVRHVWGPRPVVFHARGTQRIFSEFLRLVTRLRSKSWHIIALDVSYREAVQGQQQRGRTISARVFARQFRAWKRHTASRQGSHANVLRRSDVRNILALRIED